VEIVQPRLLPPSSRGPSLDDDIAAVLISEQQLQARVAELGRQLAADYRGRRPVLVGVLRGCVFFLADLIRHMDIDLEVDFMAISSYSSKSALGVVRVLKDLDIPLEGRHVLLVEDIIDTGLTVNYIMKLLATREPASLRLCTLLNKPARRLIDREIHYIGFDVQDVFVVGYGLDYEHRYRNLPYIGVLRPEVFARHG
jgi:hypoxanthine phosphoribosyltransferase